MYATVIRSEPLGSSMIRVVLGGDGLTSYTPTGHADAYVNLAFPPAGAPYTAAFDPAAVRAEHMDHPPVRRRYTVRRWDPARGHLTIDFVVHGNGGVAGPWARSAKPGDVLVFEGPSGGYAPDPTAEHHLLVGDESALPAIGASLEAMAGDACATALLLCDGPAAEIDLPTRAHLDEIWVHRQTGEDTTNPLLDVVADLDLPWGRVQAFVHGEAVETREVRRHLLGDPGITRAALSASPYWRRTMTDEAWRLVKPDFTAAMDHDVV